MIRIAVAFGVLVGMAGGAAASCPPPRWDFPYRGKLTVQRLDPARLAVACQSTVGPFQILAGCAAVGRGWCRVYISTLSPDPTCSLKHEIAHCNGWPRSHPQ